MIYDYDLRLLKKIPRVSDDPRDGCCCRSERAGQEGAGTGTLPSLKIPV